MKRTNLLALTAILLVAAVLFAGCKDNRTKISSILDRPDRYMDREVLVAGTVSKTYAVNLIIAEPGAYQIDDGTGKIWVTTKTGVPSEGRSVGLRGTVTGGLKIAGQTYGAVIREVERQTR